MTPTAHGSKDTHQVTDQYNAPGPTGPGIPGAPGPAAIAFVPGAVVGERYRLTRLIATDAQATEFWLARDTVLPREMAITILPVTDPTSPSVTRTLRAGRLHHPGLPQMLDMGAAGTASYVAGQWVDGATLPDLLADGPLESAIAARLTAGIADALAEVQRAGLALGAINPALVRVSMDGRVRLSHLVSRGSATTEDDVRAIGALTYLMLTGTWPLAAADAPAALRPAPRRGATELPAVKVVTSASPELSRLAEQALHPQGQRGVTFDEIAERARGFGNGDAPRPARMRIPRAASAAGPSAALSTPGGLRRERRLKLGVAGMMLTTLSVLIVIMLASVTKQVLANIVAPIEAADQQQLITPSTATTTRSVAGTTIVGETAPGSSAQTGASQAAAPVTITGAAVYDPQGEPPADYESYVDRAFDGDLVSAWPTWVYRQQFGPKGIKDGVGLILTFAKPVSPKTVTLSTTTPGTVVELRSATSANPALDSTTVLGTATLAADPVAITLPDAPTSQYLVVWITKLAPYSGDSAKNKGQFQSTIAEISVTG